MDKRRPDFVILVLVGVIFLGVATAFMTYAIDRAQFNSEFPENSEN